MAQIPKKVSDRLSSNLKRFQEILASAKSRDVGEADTVTIVKDMLADLFGYNKYTEITSEHLIKSTYCDLAVRVDDSLKALIEVKAAGLELKDNHVRQAVDYAANQGIDWVALTNGTKWRVYNVIFSKPIGQELVVDIDFSTLNPRADTSAEILYLLCKEGWSRSILGEYYEQKQALSRFSLGAVLLTDPVLKTIKKELKNLSQDIRITTDEIKNVLISEVIKREVTEGDKADEARKKLSRVRNKALKTKSQSTRELPAFTQLIEKSA